MIDTAAPSPAENIVINDNVGDKQGPVGPGDTTDDQSPTLSGEAEPGSVVDIYDNDEKTVPSSLMTKVNGPIRQTRLWLKAIMRSPLP